MSGEQQPTAKIVFEDVLKSRLIGQNSPNLEKIHELIEWLSKGNTAVRTGIDLACHDIMGKALNVSVHVLMGGCYRRRVHMGRKISIYTRQNLLPLHVHGDMDLQVSASHLPFVVRSMSSAKLLRRGIDLERHECSKMNIAVLGAGHGGHAMSADLSLAGHNVNLFEFKKFEENIRPIREKGGIEIVGTAGCRTGFAKLNRTTTDMKEAVEGTKLVMVVLPAYGRDAVFEALLPHLADEQVIVIWAGYWSALLWGNMMKQARTKAKALVSETASLMYACRRIGPAKVWVRRVKEVMPVAAFPASKTPVVVEVLKELWSQVVPAANVIETSLNNPNPTGHVPGMILNAARIEATKGDFKFFQEAQLDPVPCIKKVRTTLEAEIAEVGRRLGVRTDWTQKFYVPGKIATAPEQVATHHPDYAPDTLQYRYLTEDVPYGLVPPLSLGEQLGVKMLTTRALVQLASVVNDTDYFTQGVTAKKLGLAGLTANQIKKLVKG